jgi:hypothetical protein
VNFARAIPQESFIGGEAENPCERGAKPFNAKKSAYKASDFNVNINYHLMKI